MYAPEEAQNAITVRHIAKVLEIAVVKLWKWGRAMLKLWARHHAGYATDSCSFNQVYQLFLYIVVDGPVTSKCLASFSVAGHRGY